MFLAGRNQVMPGHSVIGAMKRFKELGYEGMELSIVRALTDVIAFDYMDDYVIERVNEVSKEIDLPITAVSCHQNYAISDLVFEAQKQLIKAAPKYGTDIVIMSTFIPFEQREGHPEVYDQLLTRTKALCDVAEDHGVKIAIEVEPNQLIHNLKIFFDIADKVNSPAYKLNFDVGHIYLSEADLYKAMEQSRDFTVYSHVENMCRGEHCHKLPWEGDIDLLAAYRKLKSCGYDGAVSLDIYLQDYEKVSPDCVKYLNEEVFSKL